MIISLILFFSIVETLSQTDGDNLSAEMELTKKLPTDPNIKIGKLENGLKYYIRKNGRPEKRAELRLVINAGSVLEDDDQQGLAHFVEHMAFNGTKNFPKQELINYLESIGMRFGPDINAYTSFDETVYMLQVPTDSAHIIEKAFQILEDWSSAVSFEDEEIDKERGVVIEEWRLGRGANARIRDKQLPTLFKNSQYAERLPIGKKHILETASYETVRRFYRDWYRPDLMAVIAIGDFDPAWIEDQIRKHFSNIRGQKISRDRTLFPVPDHKETLFAIATDPEAAQTSVSIYYKYEVPSHDRHLDYKRLILESLFNGMLNKRFRELIQVPDPPFLFGYSSKGQLIRTKEFYFLGAAVKDDGIHRGIEALVIEADRLKKHGFTQTELDRQKKEALRRIERAYNERDKTDSERYASEYIRNFLTGEPIPGIEYEFELFKKFIPEIGLTDVNRLAGNWITDYNRVILVDAPEKPGLIVPDEKDLISALEKPKTIEILPYIDKVSKLPLISDPPEPKPIVEEKKLEEIGVTEWKLANGCRVILKPTDFKNDEIIFNAFSPGGHSLVPDSNYIAAITATPLVNQSGVGQFNLIELQKKLSGKIVNVSPWIRELREGISGNTTPEDLETMFKLIHLYFTSAREDTNAYLSYLSRLKGFLENRSVDPETVFEDTIQVTMSQYHHRSRPWSENLLREMDLETSFDIYRDRFADAGDLEILLLFLSVILK